MARSVKVHYRRHDWLDIGTLKVKFGIQAKPMGVPVRRAGWRNCMEDGKPLMFETAQEREDKLRELKGLEKTAPNGRRTPAYS